MNYFTADLHLGCSWKLHALNRPFKDIKEHDRRLIENINNVCCDNDILYVLGDYMSYSRHEKDKWKKAFGMAKKIRCHKRLILGNNEQRLLHSSFNGNRDKFSSVIQSFGFELVEYSGYIDISDRKVCLVHEPEDADRECFNLFGHVHRDFLIHPIGLNVGVDVWNYQPVSEEQILNTISRVRNKLSSDKSYRVLFRNNVYTRLW